MFKGNFGKIGVAFGAASLLLALVHFWAGPFAPQPSLETAVAETAVGIRDATIRALRGEEPEPPKRAEWTIDKSIATTTAVLGGLAVILGVVSFIGREPKRLAAGAAALGASAITFQFVTWLALVLIFVILVASVLEAFDLSDLFN